MDWRNDDIDQLFKQNAADSKVEYKDSYWLEMEAMLDAEKPVKKRIPLLLFAGLILLSFGLLISYFILGKESKKDNYINKNYFEEVNRDNLLADAADQNSKSEMQFRTDASEYREQAFKNEEISSLLELSFSEMVLMNLYNPVLYGKNKDGFWNLRMTPSNGKSTYFEEIATSGKYATEQYVYHTKNLVKGHVKVPPVKSIVEPANVSNNEQKMSNMADFNQSMDVVSGSLDERSEKDNELAKVSIFTEPLLHSSRSGYYVGAGFGAGNSYLRSSKDLTTNWQVIVGYDYTMRSNVRVGFGIGFKQEATPDLYINKTRYMYALGLVEFNQDIKYDRLNFIDVITHVHYVHKKMAIGLSINPSMLLGVRSTINQRFTENGLTYEVPAAPSIKNEYVRSGSFHTVAWNAGISFQYEFAHKIVAELGVNTRLNSMLKWPTIEQVERRFPVRLNVTLLKRF